MNWLPLAISIAALLVALLALRISWRSEQHSARQWNVALRLKGLDDKGPPERWRKPVE